jgi:hypothetical protein
LDDCSPDNTAEAAKSFQDIRNGDVATNSEVRRLSDVIKDCKEIVNRAHGVSINFRNLSAVKTLIEELRHERSNPPSAPDETDLDILRRFAAGEDLIELSVRFSLDKVAILTRVENALKYTGRLAKVTETLNTQTKTSGVSLTLEVKGEKPESATKPGAEKQPLQSEAAEQ